MTHFDLYDPSDLLQPHRVTRPDHVDGLVGSIEELGWDGPPLIGYRLTAHPNPLLGHPTIQLLSGTHRLAALTHLNLPVPVRVYPQPMVEAVWGTEAWPHLMDGSLEVG